MHSLGQAVLPCASHVIDRSNFGEDAKSTHTCLKKIGEKSESI
jgi:hypothetical protein